MSRRCLLGSEFKVLGSFDTKLLLGLTFLAFQSEHNLTRRLGLFVKDGLGLTTKSHLFGIVPPLALGKVGRLTRLVLRHLVDFVLLALASAVRLALFWYVHHVGLCLSSVCT